MKKNISIVLSFILVFNLLLNGNVFESKEKASAAESYDKVFTKAELTKDEYSFKIEVQKALDVARTEASDSKPYKIYIPAGNYSLLGTLKIYSNTSLVLDSNAVVTSAGNESNEITLMLVNGNYSGDEVEDDEYSGYGSYKNISIQGGIWDGNSQGFTESKPIIFRFAHAKNISLKNITFRNEKGNHHVEAAAVDGFLVDKCTFSDAKTSGDASTDKDIEALQIDISSQDYPGFMSQRQKKDGDGFDNLPCKNVTVSNCTFKNVFRGVGSHHPDQKGTDEDIYYENITIKNNNFINVPETNILGWLWKNATIDNNNITDSGKKKEIGISMQRCLNCNITNNKVMYTEKEGIVLANGSANTIANNEVKYTDGIGISLTNSSAVSIDKNKISNGKMQGLNMTNSSVTSSVTANDIRDNATSQITINANNSKTSYAKLISKNTLENGSHGIVISPGTSTGNIEGNSITNPSNNGIYLESCKTGNISSNTVKKTGNAGIALTKASITGNIQSNNIDTTKANGIILTGENTTASSITSNTVKNTTSNGIIVNDGASLTGSIKSNSVISSKSIGIYLCGKLESIENNTVKAPSKHAIHTKNSTLTKINGNNTNGGTGGISCNGGTIKYISNNSISSSSSSGLTVTNINSLVDVNYNKVSKSTEHGICLNNSTAVNVNNNKVSESKKHGILFNYSKATNAKSNQVNNSSKAGISITNSSLTSLIGNNSNKAGEYGFAINGTSYVDYTAGNTGKNNKNTGIVSRKSRAILYVNSLPKIGLKDKTEYVEPFYSHAEGISYTMAGDGKAKLTGKKMIKATKVGTVTITAKQGNRTGIVSFKVVNAPKKVKVAKKKLTLKVKKKYQIKPSVNSDSVCYTYKFKSSKKKIASVSSTGLIKAKKKGSATITVKTYNGKKVKIKVKVKK